MTIKKRSAINAFVSLSMVVLVIGVISWKVSSKIVYQTLVKSQIENNSQQAKRIAQLIEGDLQKGVDAEKVQTDFQRSLTMQPKDDSGFVCMLGSKTEVLCHPDEKMIGMNMSQAVVRDLKGIEVTFGENNIEKKEAGGFFPGKNREDQIVYQVPIKGKGWLMSVHTNRKVIDGRADIIMSTLLWIGIPSSILLILVGTIAVRRTSLQYESQLEEANLQLEEKVRERTAELRRNYEELKKTKEKLAQSEKMSFLGQLMASITHEINNPLSAVIGSADLLLMKKNLEEKQNRLVNRIKVAGDRCQRLVQNLLTFSRNAPLERRDVPLKTIIDKVCELLETEINNSQTQFENQLPLDLPNVMVDRLQIEQVFFNLFKNAIQAMMVSEKRLITLNAESGETFIHVSVRDSGPGIPPDQLPRLFDAFFTSKKQGEGTGLGLALCQRFVQAHWGTITVESEVGNGTTFLIKLPTDSSRDS